MDNRIWILVAIGVALVILLLVGTGGSNKESLDGIVTGGDQTDPADPANANTCAPPQGIWGKPGGGLLSSCCQPPDYKLYDSEYKTCDNWKEEPDKKIQRCLSECCKNCDAEAGVMDPSWYDLCKCGCSLCCYNQKVPHFSKYGTCVHYIEGDPAEAETPDTPEAGTSSWRGWVGFNLGNYVRHK